MQKCPTIILPYGTWYVLASRIPGLIVAALHPNPSPDAPKLVLWLKRAPHLSRYRNADSVDSRLNRALGLDPPDERVNDDDWELLQNIFAKANLPPLKLPLTEEACQPYALAFKNRDSVPNLDWELEWVISNRSERAERRHRSIQEEHLSLLRSSISKGILEQLSYGTQIPSASYSASGIVKIEALTAYVKQFGIVVKIEEAPKNNAGLMPPAKRGRKVSGALKNAKSLAGDYASEFYSDAENRDVSSLDVAVSPGFIRAVFPAEDVIDSAVIKKNVQHYLRAYGVSIRAMTNKIAEHKPKRRAGK